MSRAARPSDQYPGQAESQPENVTIDAASYSDQELIAFVARSNPRTVYIIPKAGPGAEQRARVLAGRLFDESRIAATIATEDPREAAGRRSADIVIHVKEACE